MTTLLCCGGHPIAEKGGRYLGFTQQANHSIIAFQWGDCLW